MAIDATRLELDTELSEAMTPYEAFSTIAANYDESWGGIALLIEVSGNITFLNH